MGRSWEFQTMGRSLAPFQAGGLTISPSSSEKEKDFRGSTPSSSFY
jgi:hypothetical protein